MKNTRLMGALALALISQAAQAKLARCFDPYTVTVVNQSGGEAELLRGKDIAGFRRKEIIPNYRSKKIAVQDLGALITIEHGPEDKEKVDRIRFYEKTAPYPQVILKGTSIEARGFNQNPGQQYNVAIRNESGGKAKISDTCDAGIRGDIDNKDSRDARVRSGSTMVVSFGPKHNKKTYEIRFGTPIDEGKPQITLQQGGWFRSPVTGKDVRFGTSRVVPEKKAVSFGPHKQMHPEHKGGCGMRKTMHKESKPMHQKTKAKAKTKRSY